MPAMNQSVPTYLPISCRLSTSIHTKRQTKKPSSGISGSSKVPLLRGIFIVSGDLNGRYFAENNYTLTALGSTTYTLTATGTGEVAGVVITLNEAGNFTRAGL